MSDGVSLASTQVHERPGTSPPPGAVNRRESSQLSLEDNEKSNGRPATSPMVASGGGAQAARALFASDFTGVSSAVARDLLKALALRRSFIDARQGGLHTTHLPRNKPSEEGSSNADCDSAMASSIDSKLPCSALSLPSEADDALETIIRIAADPEAQVYCKARLAYLESRFDLYEEIEQQAEAASMSTTASSLPVPGNIFSSPMTQTGRRHAFVCAPKSTRT